MLKVLLKNAIITMFLGFSFLGAQTVVKIVPAQSGPVGVGQNIDLEVQFDNYVNLHGYSLVILFNKAAINLRSSAVSQGDIFSGYFPYFAATSFQDSIKVDAAILGTAVVNGANARAFTVHFQAVATGGTDIRFILSKLRNGSNQELPHSRVDGVVTIDIPLPDNSYTEAFKSTLYNPGEVNYGNTKAKLDFNYTSDGGTVTIMHYETQPPGGNSAPFNSDPLVPNPVVGPRYWEVTSSIGIVGGSQCSADLTFSYAGLPGVSDPTKLGIGRRNLGAGASDAWDIIINSDEVIIDIINEEITLVGPISPNLGLYTEGQYTILSDASDNSLPVTLTSFTAQVTAENLVELNWTTESEINNLGFYVERSAEGSSQFMQLPGGFVSGHGNSNQTNHYNYEDETVTMGTWLYRLKQVDYNGDFEYSPEVGITLDKGTVVSEFALHQNYPNPFNPSTTIPFDIPTNHSGKISLQVFDINGKLVSTLADGTWPSGTHTLQWDGSDDNGQRVASGIYYYILKGESIFLTKKMILLQ